MPIWSSAPTVEIILVITVAVGGFWCLVVCICQIVRGAAKRARKNTAMYRQDPSQLAVRGGGCEGAGQGPPHGVIVLQEASPLQPLFVPSRPPGPSSQDRNACRPYRDAYPIMDAYRYRERYPNRDGYPNRNACPNRDAYPHRNQATDSAAFDCRMGFGRQPAAPDDVIYAHYVERVMLPEYGDRPGSPCEDEDMNEEPPPYDAVEEHMDFPAPPSYIDLFPYKT